MRGLRDLGNHFTIRCDALELIDVRREMDLLQKNVHKNGKARCSPSNMSI